MENQPKQHTLYPVNIGSSVVGVRYKDGILIAADTAISYGSMKEVKGYSRIFKLNNECVLSCSGEMSDFQELQKTLREKQEADQIENDGATFLKPKDYFHYLSRLQYQRRMKMDPLWTTTVFGGVDKKTKEFFLGQVDLYGLRLQENFHLTGLAAHYCQVLMQNAWKPDLSEAEARSVIEDCFRMLFYRDKKATDEIQICKIT
mmetsp:Transcript_27019/g.26082  ORF Transcript_27019/g.26082 Transcript_27019/m.26082 type:complete len:203 (-) Transcript_27019:156-764(-)